MAEVEKSRKLKRLVAVQRHVEKMAENELSMVIRERAEVAEATNRTVRVMTSLDPLHRPLSRHYLERFAKLTSRDRQLGNLQRTQETRLARERKKGDRLEEKMKEARQAETRVTDDNAVYDLIEMTLALKDTSLQQG